jgi:hypothetical protein
MIPPGVFHQLEVSSIVPFHIMCRLHNRQFGHSSWGNLDLDSTTYFWLVFITHTAVSADFQRGS